MKPPKIAQSFIITQTLTTSMATSLLLLGGLIAIFALSFQPSSFQFTDVDGFKVVITGATSGIGVDLAHIYAENHAHVVILARNEDKMKAVVEECKDLGAASAGYVKVDMGAEDDATFQRAVEDALAQLGGDVDTVVLNHVGSSGNYLQEGWYGRHDMKDLRSAFHVNTFSYFALAQQFLPRLEARHGKLIVVGSMAGIVGLPKVAPYSASKHAIFGYFDSLRYDLEDAGSNITITTCKIGSIDTTNAREATKETHIPDFMWYPSRGCAEKIIQGGESRAAEVYYPFIQTYPMSVLRVFPSLVKAIIQSAGFS